MYLFCKHLANTISSCDCIHRWGRGKRCNLPRSLLSLTEAVLPGPASGRDGKADTDWLCHHSSRARGIAVHAQTDQDRSHLGKWEELHSPPPHSVNPHFLLVEYSTPHTHIIFTHPTLSHPHFLPSSSHSLIPYPLTFSLPHSFTSSLVHPLTGRGCSCGNV